MDKPIEFNNEYGIAEIAMRRYYDCDDEGPKTFITVKCGPIIQLRLDFGKNFANMLIDLLRTGRIYVPISMSPISFSNAKQFKKGGRCLIFDAETFGMLTSNRPVIEEKNDAQK